jgi:hypothetical protein
MKGRLAKATKSPEALTLTFKGLDHCDGCGARLDRGDRLCGLCPACLDSKAEDPIPKPRPTGDR